MILDTVGAPYVQKNCEALAMDGKIVMIGWMGGMTLKEFDLMIVVSSASTSLFTCGFYLWLSCRHPRSEPPTGQPCPCSKPES